MLSEEDLAAIIDSVIQQNSQLIKERGSGALGPLLGIVMREARGRADANVVSELTRRKLDKSIGK
jgi:glutamyl-tRNA(Gln) amidotransferase subunit E